MYAHVWLGKRIVGQVEGASIGDCLSKARRKWGKRAYITIEGDDGTARTGARVGKPDAA